MRKSNNLVTQFIKHESSGGILLFSAAVLAIIFANTPLNAYYSLLIDTPVVVSVADFEINKPLLLWVNDGLMAIFFLLIGLELKREFLQGELSDRSNLILPAVGAVGGMAIPALIYIAFNYDDPIALQGWAIPAATDIAFALGILTLLGSRVPISLKVFLTSLAILDDVGAIIIIALFYTSNISTYALLFAAVSLMALWLLNRNGVENKSIYLIIGSVMWVSLLKSGVHATLAGVLLALFIPMNSSKSPESSPLKQLEKDLHFSVVFFILPLFAFCNAGLNFGGIGVEQIFHSIPVGIALGLFVGKQLGVFFFCWATIKLGFTNLPKGMNWGSLYGIALLCGVGFTMSLFIGSLAFEETGSNLLVDERLGILGGSLISGIMGYLVLKYSYRDAPEPSAERSPTIREAQPIRESRGIDDHLIKPQPR